MVCLVAEAVLSSPCDTILARHGTTVGQGAASEVECQAIDMVINTSNAVVRINVCLTKECASVQYSTDLLINNNNADQKKVDVVITATVTVELSNPFGLVR